MSIVLGLIAFELWLRSDTSGRGRPLVLAEADIHPYLGIENLFHLQHSATAQ